MLYLALFQYTSVVRKIVSGRLLTMLVAFIRTLIAGLVLSLAPFSLVWADIQDVRVWQSPEQTRVVFDLSQPVSHKVFTLENPARVVIDVNDVKLLKKLAEVDLADTQIQALRSGKRGKDDLRIVLDMAVASSSKSFTLKPNKMYPSHRLVVDLMVPQKRTQPSQAKKSRVRVERPKDIIIAIDAGHGGEDPGAIGPRKIQEKKVVLAIAKELARLIDATPGYQAFMVRSGDYYIGLRQRTAKARKANADFFVSIHADAFKDPRAKGSSVYVLSERGATSEAARWLADKENEADLIGGVNLGQREDHLAMTLLDLSMTHKRNASIQIGESILSQIGSMTRLHKKRVEEAAFVVLKSPDMPALLVETGFISNPEEARKLSDKAYQKRLAQRLHRGITGHFSQQPPAGTTLAQLAAKNRADAAMFRSYQVRRGDTLSELAVENNVTLSQLRKMNALKNDVLKIGQTLKLPRS